MDRWYASDHHFDHFNIIAYGARPFKDVKEMNDALITFHNVYVKPQDHVTFLGDVTMRRGGLDDKEWFIKLMRSLNGHKRLHLGNHDHFPIKTYLEAGFEKIYATNRADDIVFSHFPLHPTSIGASAIANVHGHTHQHPDLDPAVYDGKVKPYFNISVERTDYRPISIDEIKQVIATKVREYERDHPVSI